MSWTRKDIARRAAAELNDGDYVNLGIGIPTLVPDYLEDGRHVFVHSENGLLGVGTYPTEQEYDPDVINAAKETVSAQPGAAFFDSALSFAMIRGGHIDVALLGAMEVSQHGDLANWAVPGKLVKGIGGAMDLIAGAKRVIVLTQHVSKDATSKLVRECSLPLTGRAAVSRVITDLAVIDVNESGFVVVELADGVDAETVTRKTDAPLTFAPGLGIDEFSPRQK